MDNPIDPSPVGRPSTDDAAPDVVLSELRYCASLWQGGARLLGNIRATDIVRALDLLASASIRVRELEARPSVEICQAERAEGNGGCGACALCCKEQRDAKEAAESRLSDLQRRYEALEQEHEELRARKPGSQCEIDASGTGCCCAECCPYCAAALREDLSETRIAKVKAEEQLAEVTRQRDEAQAKITTLEQEQGR